ncbi:hypothetical protein [Cellulomonas sp. Y8]|uniref:hypothetical protein n=1 Tax=Cellulomonas sp. Y8 TaxID=2591145 RepID=UPI0011CB7087|nr:hypothetical protein [Cellulomonas sp. Y8]
MELERWLRRRCEEEFTRSGRLISAVRAMRTSSTSVDDWLASAATSFAAADRRDPDVASAIDLGFDVVRRDSTGEARRRELGDAVFVIRQYHAPGGSKRAQIGVLLHVGRTFFVYLLSSARASNLEAETKDRAGNASTEVISSVVRAMAAFGSRNDDDYRPHLYAREHERIVRDVRHGENLKETLTRCRAIAHIPQTYDMTRSRDAGMFQFGSMMASNNASAVIVGMNRAEVVMQAHGRFYEDIKLAPFTHGPAVVRERDRRNGMPVETVDKHRLSVTDDVEAARRTLRLLVDRILAGEATGSSDWHAVGELMAERGLESRLPTNRKRGLLLQDTDPSGWAEAARSLFAERWIEGWRSGRFTKRVKQKVDLELDGLDLELERAEDGKRVVVCSIDMPLPEGGWGVSDEEWDRVLALRYPKGRKPRQLSGHVLPFAGLDPWQDERGTWKVMPAGSIYKVYVGPERAGAAWKKWCGDAQRVATIRPREWHRSLAAAAEDALSTVGDVILPLWDEPGRRGSSRARTAIEADRRRLERQIKDADMRVDGAVETYNELRGMAMRDQSAPAEQRAERAKRAWDRAEWVLAGLRAELAALEVGGREAEPEPEEAWASTATVEFVVAALSTSPGSAPAWLQRACASLFRDLRVAPATSQRSGRRELEWSCMLVLPVRTDDGAAREVAMPLSGRIFDRANASSASPERAATGSEVWAWHFFYRGASMAEIGVLSGGIDGSGKKNSYLYKGLSAWLGEKVTESTYVNALLDCPVAETRRAVWWAVTGDDASVRGLDEGFVRHVAATYTTPARLQTWGWCHDSHDLARSVADYLLRAGGSASMLAISADLGVAHDDLVALTRVNGTQRPGEVKVRARHAVSPFERNWVRSTRWMTADEKRLSLRECPHADCPERLRGRTPYASHVLATPETVLGHGVLCPSCRRLPVAELGGVRFPSAYLRPWSGRFGVRARARQRQHVGTHLDPARPDHGPGAPLADTGARPRPETRRNLPGTHVAKALQGAQLAGRSFLFVGVDERSLARLHELVESRGGRIATRLRATAAGVVAGPAGCRDPRVARARDLGVPVFDLEEFDSEVRAGWRPQPLATAA